MSTAIAILGGVGLFLLGMTGALGFIELEQKSTGFLNFGTELKNPNFAGMAKAMGIRGVRLEDPADVKHGIAEAGADGQLPSAFAHSTYLPATFFPSSTPAWLSIG